MKHVKYHTMWSTPSTPFHEPRQARKARHLADSDDSESRRFYQNIFNIQQLLTES